MDPEHAEGKQGADVVCRSFACSRRSINEKERTVDVIMSTDTIDRYGERVAQDWDISAFEKNPVVLWAHSSRELPIGRAENVRVSKGALQGTIRFASAAANPVAEQCFQLFREDVLNAVSVGFIPHTVKYEKEKDKEVLVLSENELIELSCTPVPANPEALAKMRALALRHAPKQQSLPMLGANQEKSTMDLEQRIKELEAAATKSAETMSVTAKALETANAKAAELTDKLAESEKSLKAAREMEEQQSKRAVEAESRAKTAEASLIKAGVEALVGKKITPAEADEFIELATKQPELYAKMIAKRADLPTAINTVVVDAEKGTAPAPVSADGGHGEGLAALIDKSAEADDEDAA